ncbi:MAG: hypothetical protein ABI042_08180, partial [Verrucomicrobiota bacterium]
CGTRRIKLEKPGKEKKLLKKEKLNNAHCTIDNPHRGSSDLLGRSLCVNAISPQNTLCLIEWDAARGSIATQCSYVVPQKLR